MALIPAENFNTDISSMNSSHTLPASLKDFDDMLRTGESGPRTLIVSGMNDAREDWRKFTGHLPGQYSVPGNPYYRGKRPWIHNVVPHDQQLSADLAELMRHTGCERIIGHSRGCFLALMAMKNLRETGGNVPRAVMMNPPLQMPPGGTAFSSRLEHRDDPLQHNIDVVLNHACQGMDDETYREMVARHASEYGSRLTPVLRHAMDASRGMSEMINDVGDRIEHTNVPTLILAGEKDLFHSNRELRFLASGRRHITSQVLAGRSHYPHIENPEQTAEAIAAWEQSISAQ